MDYSIQYRKALLFTVAKMSVKWCWSCFVFLSNCTWQICSAMLTETLVILIFLRDLKSPVLQVWCITL